MSAAFLDAREALTDRVLHSSVCIIGAGAAGITLARRLAGRAPDVLLVESGALHLDPATQYLYAGENIGLPYYDLMSSRLRYFGGSTNHWGGYCRANDPIDYEGRPDLEVPAWPVDYQTLQPYVEQAAAELRLDDPFPDIRAILPQVGLSTDDLLDGVDSGLQTKTFAVTERLRFADIYADDLATQRNLRVVLNLNVIHVALDPTGRVVDHLVARTLTGERFELRAQLFVLACHAIENARLLLASNDVQPAGIGNNYDHVGRYFMEHAHLQASRFYPTSRFPVLYSRPVLAPHNFNANLGLDETVKRRLGILQYYCRFQPVFAEPHVEVAARRAFRSLMEPVDRQFIEDVLTTLTHLDDIRQVIEREIGFDRQPLYYELQHRIEQAPNPNSRVTLDDQDRDGLGLPRANLHWELNELDRRTFERGQEFIVQELSARGLGRVAVEEMTKELIEARVAGHWHHIGTTRMSAAPKDGVVDRDCRVHGVDNLYIAGSSVFPTAGYSGPTMMLMALAMRLADEIERRFDG